MSDDIRYAIEQRGGLVNAGELARTWGVTPGRVGQLVRKHDFPAPIAEVAGRPVWLADEVHEWRQERMRQHVRS